MSFFSYETFTEHVSVAPKELADAVMRDLPSKHSIAAMTASLNMETAISYSKRQDPQTLILHVSGFGRNFMMPELRCALIPEGKNASRIDISPEIPSINVVFCIIWTVAAAIIGGIGLAVQNLFMFLSVFFLILPVGWLSIVLMKKKTKELFPEIRRELREVFAKLEASIQIEKGL